MAFPVADNRANGSSSKKAPKGSGGQLLPPEVVSPLVRKVVARHLPGNGPRPKKAP